MDEINDSPDIVNFEDLREGDWFVHKDRTDEVFCKVSYDRALFYHDDTWLLTEHYDDTGLVKIKVTNFTYSSI